jgi:hypothetical protein
MSRLRLRARVSAILLLLSVGLVTEANLAYAQSSNANLSGVVTDVSGAVVVDAQLTLSNTASKSVSTYQSDAGGRYVFRDVQPGTYSLQVAKTGFETTVQTGIVLTINASAHADVTLKVGAGSQRVEVQDSTTSLVNYDNATVQGGIEPQTLKDLPIAIANGNQRSSAQLAVLLPGVTTSSGGDAYNARINGGQQSGDEAILDGATLSEGYLSQSGMVAIHTDFPLSPDMISELKVVTSTYEPQYGFTTSGQIVAETKSGGTSFHGSAYAYLRNDGLNALQWGLPAGTGRTFDHETDAGANIGGPIKLPGINSGKNKAFFFFNWEPYRLNGGAQRPTLTIPTLKERAGDFTDNVVDGKLVPIYDPRTGQQFSCNGVLNVICPNLEDPIAKAWLAQLPTPTNSGTSNNYLAPHAVPNSLYTGSDAYLFRIDDNWGDLDRFAFSFYRRYNNSNLSSALPTSISSAQGQPGHSGVYRFNWEHAFSGKTLNHFTLGYLDLYEDILSADTQSTVKMPVVPGVANTTTYLPTFNIGDLQLGEPSGPPGHNISTRPTWAINDIFSRVVGSHTLVAGVEWRSAQGNANGGTNQGGTFSFGGVTANNNSTDPANSNADFFIGAANGGSVSYYNVPAIYVRQTAWAVHLGDTWRFSPKLTLSYGLRWDMETPTREKYNHASFFDPTLPNPDAGGLLGAMAFATSNRPYPEHVDHAGFAPRLGVAYAFRPSTVIRAGYGIFFGQAFYPGWGGGNSLDGYNINSGVGSPGLTGPGQVIPAMCLTPGNAFCVAAGVPANGYPTPASLASSLTPGIDNGLDPLYRPFNANERSRAQQWNLTIERQLPWKTVVSAGYVGSHGTHLLSALQPLNVLNPNNPLVIANGANLQDTWSPSSGVPEPYPGWASSVSCATVGQALLPYPQYCSTLSGLNENVGNSIYHSFQGRLEKRLDQGIYMLLSYTNSKTIEDASSNTQTQALSWAGSNGVISPYQRYRARSLASDDVPQVVSAAFVYDLPFGHTKRFLNTGGALDRVVGGWQISPIFRYSRGIPFFFRDNGICKSYVGACIPGVIPGVDPFLQDPNHFNPYNLALCPPGHTLGDPCAPLLNKSAFEPLQSFSTPGYSGYGRRISNIRGPNFKDLDFSLTKNTRITERVNFKFSLNFFNALNAHYFVNDESQNFGGDTAFNTDISSGSDAPFGTWNTAVSQPRTIQAAGRIEF